MVPRSGAPRDARAHRRNRARRSRSPAAAGRRTRCRPKPGAPTTA